jgi:hypothetical protein
MAYHAVCSAWGLLSDIVGKEQDVPMVSVGRGRTCIIANSPA